MSWILGLLVAFAFLGTRRQPRVDVHALAFIAILIALAYAAVRYDLL